MTERYLVGDIDRHYTHACPEGTPHFKLWGHSFGTFSSDPIAPVSLDRANEILAGRRANELSPTAAMYAVVPAELLHTVQGLVKRAMECAGNCDYCDTVVEALLGLARLVGVDVPVPEKLLTEMAAEAVAQIKAGDKPGDLVDADEFLDAECRRHDLPSADEFCRCQSAEREAKEPVREAHYNPSPLNPTPDETRRIMEWEKAWDNVQAVARRAEKLLAEREADKVWASAIPYAPDAKPRVKVTFARDEKVLFQVRRAVHRAYFAEQREEDIAATALIWEQMVESLLLLGTVSQVGGGKA